MMRRPFYFLYFVVFVHNENIQNKRQKSLEDIE